jgi:hypothetical protein
MNAHTRQFLEARYNTLRVELVKSREEQDRLNEQMAECILRMDSVTEEMREIIRAANAIGLTLAGEEELPAKGRKTGNITIQNAVLQILEEQPEGLTSSEILQHLRDRFKLYVARTSLSPQLTRLKDQKKLDLAGSVWALRLPDDPFDPSRSNESGSRS